MKKVTLVLTLTLGLSLLAATASAQTFFGTDGADTFNGTDENDVFWTYAGQDEAHGKSGSDDIHLGEGRDFGAGGDGPDVLWGGDNPGTGAWEVIKGQGAADDLNDTAGSGSGNGDLDDACGGPQVDYANIFDNDNSDFFWSGPANDNHSKDPGDTVSNQDCP